MNAPGVEAFRADFRDLVRIALEAFAFCPPLYLESILGPSYTWFYPPRVDSEFSVINPWAPVDTLRFLRDITVPSVPRKVPRLLNVLPPVIKNSFWRTSGYFQQSDPFDSDNSFSNERWFYVNGICTDRTVAQINSHYLSKMFCRPITVVHVNSNSFLVDLFQCALGKGIRMNPDIRDPQSMTEPSIKATIAVLDALSAQEIDRVVVVCHSQGTIIVSNVIKAIANIVSECSRCAHPDAQVIERIRDHIIGGHEDLLEVSTINTLRRSIEEFTEIDQEKPLLSVEDRRHALQRKVAKFEVYAFANCATSMKYIMEMPGKDPFPYIESFANQKDLVARLGVISPQHRPGGLVSIDGPVYVNTRSWWERYSAWGHLLNQHYLFAMSDYLSHDVKNRHRVNPYRLASPGGHSATPRLYQYFNGGSPEPLKR